MMKVILVIGLIICAAAAAWAGGEDPCDGCGDCMVGGMASEVELMCDINQDGDMLDCCCCTDVFEMPDPS